MAASVTILGGPGKSNAVAAVTPLPVSKDKTMLHTFDVNNA